MALVGGIVGPSSSAVLEGWFAQREAQRQLEEAMAGTPQQDWTTAGKAAARLKHRDHVVADGEANTAAARSEQSKYPPISQMGPWSQPSSTTKLLDSPKPQVKGFDEKTSQELSDRREEHKSTYRNADGTETTVYSQNRVNYRGADGKWQRVDTNLKQDNGGWRNTADAVTTRLAGRADAQQLVTLELDRDHAMSYRLQDAAAVAGQATGSAVTYPGVRPRSDLRITATPGGFKEDLVLHSADAPTTWLFPLQLKGLSAKVVDNAVVLTDGKGTERAVIPAGFMTDSNVNENTGDPATSYGVRYEIVDGSTLKVELDQAWLKDGARKFPVTVDPSVIERNRTPSMYVQRTNGSSFTRSDGLELKVGHASGGINATTYLKFPGIENDLRDHRIFGAQLFLLNYYSWSCRPFPMQVHAVTQDWNEKGSYAYPGPSVDHNALTSSSFAQGYIPRGANSSACPATGQAINLGDAGRDLVQRWVNHQQGNFGLSLRASETDPFGWKKIAGHASAVPPTLYVTHSPYNASYHIENGVPSPPVTRNQDGVIKVKVTNLGKDTWRPGEYFLAYRRFDARGGYQTETESAQLPHDVPRGQSVTLDAKIGRIEPGQYSLEFTMVHKGVKVFTDEQVAPARLGLQVFDVPPIVTGQYPPNGHSAPSLEQQLWVNATDVDAPGGSALKYRFEVCEADKDNKPIAGSCFDSGRVDRPTWTIPQGKIRWSKTYLWRAFAFDGNSESEALPYSALLTNVPQPEVTSQIGAAPYSGGDRDFNPVNGNYTSAAVDASLATVGPDLTLARTYNSLDPRRDLAFGSGWVSRLDMRVVEDTDGSGNVVVTYPDGQTVRFGAHRKTDGTFDRTYAPPPGRFATFFLDTIGGTETYVLVDKAANQYKFRKSDGRLIEIHDAHRRGVKLAYDLPEVGPTRITSTVSNRQLNLEWGTNKHVKRVWIQETETKLLEWKYTYDATDTHKLISVCNPKNECTNYEYEQGSHYRSVVLDSRPKHYWRLGEGTGDSARSEILTNLGKDAGKYKDVQLGKVSPLDGNQNPAAGFNGTSSVVELPRDAVRLSRDVAVELWFRTTANGPLIGYQDKAITEDAHNGVPLLYVGEDGKLRGQFWNGQATPLTSNGTVNDGQWHHVVLSGSVSKQQLFVDGAQQGGDLDGAIDHLNMSFAQVGAGNGPNGVWPSFGTGKRRHFTGEIDEVAVYEHSLGLPAVKAHLAEKAQAPHLTKIKLPSGRTASTIAYDHGSDRVREVVDADGGKWKIDQPIMTGSEDNLIRTIQVTDPGERLHSYDYDAKRSRILRYISPIGMSTRPEDRLPQTAAPTTNPNCQPASGVEDGAPVFCVGKGGTTPPQIVDSAGKTRGVRSYDYDASGFQSTITDELGNQVTMVNDERGNVKQTTNCRRSGTDCFTSYVEHFLNPADFTDPRNDKVIGERDARSSGPADDRYVDRSEYDPRGNLLKSTAAGGQVVTHEYTTDTSDQAVDGGNVPEGLVKRTEQTGSGVTLYRYFRNGDLASATSATNVTTSYKYDSLGRKTEETESSPTSPTIKTTYTYDDLSRVVATTDPAVTNTVSGVTHTKETRTGYDADGNRTKLEVVDLTGGDAPRVATFGYDDRGRLAEEVDAEGRKTSHGYDHFGNKMWTVTPGGVRTDFTYTARNKVAEVWLRGYTGDPVDPTRPNEDQADQEDAEAPSKPGKDSLLVHSYIYDLAGRLYADVDAMGRTTRYAYYRDNSLRAIVAVGAGRDADGNRRDITVQDNVYDPAGHLIRQTVAGGLVTEYQIDEAGRTKKTVQDPGGLARTTELTYDAAGQVTRVVKTGNPSNFVATGSVTEVVDFEYDPAGRQTKEIIHRGASAPIVTERTYDAHDRVRTEVDPRGVADPARRAEYTNSYSYDVKGQLVQLTGPQIKAEENGGAAENARARITSGYNTFGQLTDHRDANGQRTVTTYDKLGRQVSKKSPAYTPPGTTTPIVPEVRTEYEPDGKVSAVIDAGGAITRFRYNQLGQLVEKVLPSPQAPTEPGAKLSYVHTRTGELLTTTDPSGAITKRVYDDLKRPVAATQLERKPRSAVFTSTVAYDDAGRVLKSTNPVGDVAEQVYDKLGQRIRTIDPDGSKTEFGYDGAGREVRTIDGLGRITDRVYNQVGWLTGTLNIAADGSFIRGEQLKHDAVGNVVEEIDALGRSTKFTYDAADRLVQQVEPVSATDSITTTFGYNIADQRTRTTDGRGNSTITAYNTLGLPEKVVEPATPAHPDEADRTWTTTYDSRGLATKVQVPGGITRERTYDALGRLRTESGSGAAHATQTRTRDYDERGLVVGVNARNTKNVYTYNDRGQLLTATGPSGDSSFGYDAAGRLTSKTDAAGTNTFTYLKGRLSSIQDGVTNALQSLSYNAAGDLDRITYGPDAIRKYEYDTLGRQVSDKIETSTGASIGSITYGYDLNDQLTSKVTTGTAGASSNTYGYDHAGRMTSWTSNGVETKYEWDKSGNRVRAGDKVSTFDERNRLLSDGDYTYTYSARGTLEGRTSSGLTDTYGWDAFDQAVLRGSTSFTYDGMGRMIGRNGGTFAYSGFGIDPVSDGESTFSRGVDGSLLAVGSGDQKKLTISDRHGDVVGTLKPGGTSIEDSVAYDPFGKRIAGSGLRVGYQGDWTDPESGEVNMGARWYNPSSGSFTSRDSIGLPSSPSIALNRYTYGAGAPMNYDDPDGHFFGWIKDKAKQVGNAISDGAKAAWNWAKTDGLELVKEVSGYNDIKGCLTNPSWGGCAMAALNFIPAGKVVNLAAKGIKAGVKAVKATKIGRAADNLGGGASRLMKSAGDLMRAAGKVVTEIKWVKVGGKLVKQTVTRVVKGAAKYGAGAARAVARSAGDIIRSMPGHAFAKMAAEQAAKRIPPSTFAALRKPMVSAKDLVVTSPFSPANIVSHALDNVVDGGAVLDFFRTMVLKNTDDVIKEAPAAARMGSEVAQGAGAKVDDFARPGRAGGAKSDDLTGKACSLASRLGVTNSFVPGTLVLMADGSRKKIENLRAGEYVLATDPTTGKTGARKVTETRTKVSLRTMVELTDSSGGKIKATDEHPFWVESEKRWVKAIDLKPSYRFLTADNRSAEVTGTRSWSGIQKVHNFTVDGLHTYYVASSREAAPLLVHNEDEWFPTEAECKTAAIDIARDGADAAQAPGVSTGTYESLVLRDGSAYGAGSGRIGGRGYHANQDVQDFVDWNTPKEKRKGWHGWCALPDCIAQAFADGKTAEDLRGAYVGAARVAEEGDSQHGRYVPPCPSCQPMVDEFGLNRAKHKKGGR